MCEVILKSTDNVGSRAITKFFLKIASYLDLVPSNLKVEHARDIIIPKNCVKLH